MAPRRNSSARAGRFFDPAGVFWRVNREMLTVLAGARAVLLELAHPLVAEGVARHSDFRRNRFGRLLRTLRLMIACNFGDEQQVRSELRHMAGRHRRVAGELDRPRGPYASGARYSAANPRLRLWVWATLIDSTLKVYELLIRPLSAQEKQSYYADALTLAELLDIPRTLAPADYAAFESYFNRMLAGGEITVSATAREQARALFEGPLSGPAVRAASLIGISLLPPRIREELNLEWTAVRERRAKFLTRICRRLRKLLPAVVCAWPQATRGEWAVARARRSHGKTAGWKQRRSYR